MFGNYLWPCGSLRGENPNGDGSHQQTQHQGNVEVVLSRRSKSNQYVGAICGVTCRGVLEPGVGSLSRQAPNKPSAGYFIYFVYICQQHGIYIPFNPQKTSSLNPIYLFIQKPFQSDERVPLLTSQGARNCKILCCWHFSFWLSIYYTV